MVGAAGETELEWRPRRKILGEDQPGLQGRALGGQVVEQAAETDQVYAARAIGQGRVFLAKAAEPAEQMGVAAQLLYRPPSRAMTRRRYFSFAPRTM